MLAEILPAIMLAGAALVIPIFLLRAMRRRQEYCGENPGTCFWCTRDCDHFSLNKTS